MKNKKVKLDLFVILLLINCYEILNFLKTSVEIWQAFSILVFAISRTRICILYRQKQKLKASQFNKENTSCS